MTDRPSTPQIFQRKVARGVVARPFAALGQYPQITGGTEDASYFFSELISFSLTRVIEKREVENYYSEVEWAHAEEICLYAALSFSWVDGEGAVMLYPYPTEYNISFPDDAKLNDPQILDIANNLLSSQFQRDLEKVSSPTGMQWPTPPPIVSGHKYKKCSQHFAWHRFHELMNAMDSGDHLMTRALSTWLRSTMLACHPHFLEEAIVAIFISLEASFRLILRRLKAEGKDNPSSRDAAEFLASAFSETPLEKYFPGFYNSRIMAMHPESRFGVFPHAPLMASDLYHLRASLRALYTYLLTDDPNEPELQQPRGGA